MLWLYADSGLDRWPCHFLGGLFSFLTFGISMMMKRPKAGDMLHLLICLVKLALQVLGTPQWGALGCPGLQPIDLPGGSPAHCGENLIMVCVAPSPCPASAPVGSWLSHAPGRE